MAKSIIQDTKECYVCNTTVDLHKHHIFYGTSNRKNSEKTGCWCWLCARHHNMSDAGIHFNYEADLQLKQTAQVEFERTHTREEFRNIFGKSWI